MLPKGVAHFGKVIGLTGPRYDSDTDCVDVAIWLLPDYWGKGLGTEILKECLSFCFDRLALKRVVGIVDPLNGASKGILEKCGMTFEGIIDYHGEKCELYSKLKSPNNPVERAGEVNRCVAGSLAAARPERSVAKTQGHD